MAERAGCGLVRRVGACARGHFLTAPGGPPRLSHVARRASCARNRTTATGVQVLLGPSGEICDSVEGQPVEYDTMRRIRVLEHRTRIRRRRPEGQRAAGLAAESASCRCCLAVERLATLTPVRHLRSERCGHLERSTSTMCAVLRISLQGRS